MLPAMLPRRSTSHELQLQRELDGLRTMICRLRRELETKQGVVGRLETLVHERDEGVIPIPIAEAQDHLCRFFAFLPLTW